MRVRSSRNYKMTFTSEMYLTLPNQFSKVYIATYIISD